MALVQAIYNYTYTSNKPCFQETWCCSYYV